MKTTEPFSSEGKLHLLTVPEGEERRRELIFELFSCLCPPEEARRQLSLLLSYFGSFRGIFFAPEEELRKAGASSEAARLLKLTVDLSRAYLEDRADSLRRVFDTASACEVMRPQFLGRKAEAMAVLLLNARGQVLYHGIVVEGSVTAVPIYIRRLLELCINYGAYSCFLAHNHPSDSVFPSRNDITATRQIEMALRSIDARLQDHIIFGGNDFYSFRKSGILAVEREKNSQMIEEELKDARELEQALQKQREDQNGL